MSRLSKAVPTVTRLAILAAVLILAIQPWSGAAGQSEPKETKVTLAPIEQPQGQPAILMATLTDADDKPVGDALLRFYVETDAFGPRLMKVGEAHTDTTGVASVPFSPTWVGENKVTVIYPGGTSYSTSRAEGLFQAVGPVKVHANAEFGIQTVRDWAPLVAFALVIAVWATLILVLFRTFRAMRRIRPAQEAVPAISARAGQALPTDER